jgi:hypothetical protein
MIQRERATARRRGAALLSVLVVMLVLTAMAALLLGSAGTAHLQVAELQGKTRSHLAADAAARAAARFLTLEGQPDVYPDEHGWTRFGGGEFRYTLNPAGADHFEARTLARFPTASGFTYSELDVHLEFVVSDITLPGTVTVQSGQTNVDLPVQFNGSTGWISGHDHTASGTPIAGGDVVSGLAAESLARTSPAGTADWEVTTTAVPDDDTPQTYGSPDTTSAAAALDPAMIVAIERAAAHPDYDFGAGSIGGAYGSPTDPIVMRVQLGAAEGVRFQGNFKGWGLLVISVDVWDPGADGRLIDFAGTSDFRGLVYVQANELRPGPDSAVLRLDGGGGPSVHGGIVFSSGTTYDFDPTADLILDNGNGSLVYSTEALELAARAMSAGDYHIAAYRVLR